MPVPLLRNRNVKFPSLIFVPIIITVFFQILSPILSFSNSELAQDTSHQPQLFPLPQDTHGPQESFYPEWWGKPPEIPDGVPCENVGKCVQCHQSSALMDRSHAIACVRCHGGDSGTQDKQKAHVDLLRDPGDLRVAERTCGQCHPDETARVLRSPMALAPRMINHTRFAFGAQKDSTAKYAARDVQGLKQVPHPEKSSNLGDDLLRRSCLRCHLYTPGSGRAGERRGQGCSACHVAFSNGSDGKPPIHRIIRNVGATACLKCHNGNHVGADYVGLFEKDSERGFRSPFAQGRQPARIYGSEQHRLAPDIHFQAGMGCGDCHILDEIHGRGEIPKSAVNQVKISCESCHVSGDHPAITKREDGRMTLPRSDGRTIPKWNPDLVPHRINGHRLKLRCSACHAAWSSQDYGLHLMLEERPDYWKWAPTAGQNDPQIQELLYRNIGTEAELVSPSDGLRPARPQDQWGPPFTKDWLTEEVRPGAWFRGFTARRWSRPPLGLDHRGKVSVMRPMFQYVISHVDADENLVVDRHIPRTAAGFPALIFNPYTPHTTARLGRACQDCHGNSKAAGLGEGFMGIEKGEFNSIWRPEQKVPGHSFVWDALVNQNGEPLQFSSHPGAGPLDAKTLNALLKPSARQRAMWYRYLKGE
jgi:hypothetical protein